MVGLFSRISGRVAHRPQQSLEEKEVENLVRDVPPSGNGVDHSEEFAPVEHPLEPRDIDKPARCPAPEPSIVHDGRIWKERVAVARRRLDMVNEKDDIALRRRRSLSSEHLILPSRSAPANVINALVLTTEEIQDLLILTVLNFCLVRRIWTGILGENLGLIINTTLNLFEHINLCSTPPFAR
ncbi:unnamed protein product [Calypogeia fissa]